MTEKKAVVAAILCVGVAVVHVADQGGVTAFADPDWLGWAYRLLEVGSVVTAVALLTGRLPLPAWVAALLVGLGPFVGYVLTRSTGLPGDHDDVGNWGEPLGVASLVIEGVLVLVALWSANELRHRVGRDRREQGDQVAVGVAQQQ